MTLRRPAVVIVGSLVGVAGVLACSTFSSDAPPAATPDAATEPLGADGPATTPDDGGDAADAQRPTFCVLHADSPLCADFDSENPVSYGFQIKFGAVTRDEGRSVSTPASARFDQNGGEAYLERKLAAKPALASTQRLTFELAPPDHDAGAKSYDVVVASVDQGGSEGCTFDLETFGTSARINVRHAPADDGGTVPAYENVFLTAFPAAGRFNNVDMLLSTDPAGIRVVIRIQQAAALDRVFACPPLAQAPTLRVGTILPGGATPQQGTAYFDNVLFDTK